MTSPPPVEPTRLGREYAKLWAANAVSSLGDGVTMVAGPLLAATLTRDPFLISAAAFAQRLPWFLFALVSGALADRMDRRKVMVVTDTLRALAMGGLGLVIALDQVNLAFLYAVFFVLGAAETLFDNAAVAVLPAVVKPQLLERANGRLLAVRTLAGQLIAAPVGGWLFAVAIAAPFLVDAGSFLLAAGLAAALRGVFKAPREPSSGKTSLREEIGEGVRWLAHHKLLRTLAIMLGAMDVTLSAAFSLLVLVAQNRLGLDEVGYGILLTTFAIGGIAGGLAASRISKVIGPGTALRVGLLIEAATHLVLATTRHAVVAGAIFVLFSIHAMVWGTIAHSLKQAAAPSRLLGRVNSAFALLATSGAAFGALAGGAIASQFGLTTPFWIAGIAMLLLAALSWPRLTNRAVRAAREVKDH